MTVESERTCYGEATAQVVTAIVRQGPKGTAAEFSARLPDATLRAVTFTNRGTCRTATRFSFTGRWAGRRAMRLLPNALKTLCFQEEAAMRNPSKNVPTRHGSASGALRRSWSDWL